MPARRNSSAVWSYIRIQKNAQGGDTYHCTESGCKWQGGVPFSTSNAKRHLLNAHSITLADRHGEVNTTPASAPGSDEARVAPAGSGLEAVSATPTRRTSLLDFGVTSLTSSTEDMRTLQLNMMISGRLSFEFMDNPDWQKFATAARFPSWSGKTFKRDLVTRADQLRSAFVEVLRRCPGVSLCVDEWSDRMMLPYMGLVVFTVDLEFNMAEHSPGLKFIEDAATAETLLDWVKEQLQRFNIRLEDLSSATTDNAANISKAFALAPELDAKQRLYCVPHLINIAVKKSTTSPLSRDEVADVLKDANLTPPDDASGQGLYNFIPSRVLPRALFTLLNYFGFGTVRRPDGRDHSRSGHSGDGAPSAPGQADFAFSALSRGAGDDGPV
jgi:hypothetical protein